MNISELSLARENPGPYSAKLLAFQHNHPTVEKSITTCKKGLYFSRQTYSMNSRRNNLLVDAQDRNNVDALTHSNSESPRIPHHVAFICDGNSRWATARGLPSAAGHLAGADRLVKIIASLKESGVTYCTMYAFSTENWKRPQQEIDDLLRIMEECCHRFYNRVMRDQIQVKVLGDLDDERIPNGLRSAFRKLEQDTAENSASKQQQGREPFTVCFALNYGGRKDLLNASLKMAEMIACREVEPEDVDEELLSSLLCTHEIPDPDLIIRTSGECRLSNFLLWNAAYAELYFTDVLWPDFSHDSWQEALQWYSQRQRKFGGRHQVNNSDNMEELSAKNGAAAAVATSRSE